MQPQSPLFHVSPAVNPVAHDWNWVFIPYLDGGYYAGTRNDTPVVNGTALHFRGSFNVKSIISTLAKNDALSAATDVVLSGCSSGSVSVVANGDNWHDLVTHYAPRAELSAFVDSGYYLNVNTEYWTKPVLNMQLIGRTLNAECISKNPHSPWVCIVAEVTAPFLEKLPLFVWESRYDTNQLDCVNIDPKNVSGVNAYGSRLLHSISSWVLAATKLPRGAFVDACSRHCDGLPGIRTPNGATPVTAFADWLENKKRTNKAFVVQPGEYPCKHCCHTQQTDALSVVI